MSYDNYLRKISSCHFGFPYKIMSLYMFDFPKNLFVKKFIGKVSRDASNEHLNKYVFEESELHILLKI